MRIVSGRINALEHILEFQMQEPLTTMWNPPHGLDHVSMPFSLDLETSDEYHLDGWSASEPKA